MSEQPVSERKIAANRRNARKSTGPRTPEGKARSALNALKHGLLARGVVLPNDPDESPDELRDLLDALHNEFDSASAFEYLLVERLVALHWRLRRAYRYEVEAVLDHRHRRAAPLNQVSRELQGITRPPGPAWLPGPTEYERLIRYEGMLDRAVNRLTAQLLRLRELRMRAAAPTRTPRRMPPMDSEPPTPIPDETSADASPATQPLPPHAPSPPTPHAGPGISPRPANESGPAGKPDAPASPPAFPPITRDPSPMTPKARTSPRPSSQISSPRNLRPGLRPPFHEHRPQPNEPTAPATFVTLLQKRTYAILPAPTQACRGHRPHAPRAHGALTYPSPRCRPCPLRR